MKEEIKIKNPWLGLIKQRKRKGYIIKIISRFSELIPGTQGPESDWH